MAVMFLIWAITRGLRPPRPFRPARTARARRLWCDVEIRESEDGTPVTVQVVTFLVSPTEAESLALADSRGEIRLALRNTTDLESAETPGERLSRLFAGVRRGPVRSTVRSAAPTARESAIEIYRGGVGSLIRY